MNDHNKEQQLRFLEEVCTCLHRAGFETQPLEDSQMPVYWNGVPLCRITGKGSVFYRREDVNTPLAEDALIRVEDIATQTMEYLNAMETDPQLKASGLDGDYRILAGFGGTVLAGCPSKYGTQFVTWDRDFDHKGVSHGHYYTGLYASGNYEAAKRDFATRSGLIPEQQVFREERLIEIYRCCADTLQNDTALSYKREKTIQEVQEQIEQCLPDIAERIQQQNAEPTQEQTM